MADRQFTIRKAATAGLRDAYRLHLDAGALTKLGLATGALCEIHQDNIVGYGIAWRATDSSNSPRNPPVQISETMRETFNFQLGKQVKIEKSTRTISEAGKVVLVDVTPADYETDDGPWETRCKWTLLSDNCEAVAAGMTFDVAAKKGLRKRYFVEHIDGVGLYTVGDKTEAVFSLSQGTHERGACTSGQVDLRIDSERIGGLKSQIEELNKRLSHLCGVARRANTNGGAVKNSGILIHGYEGTGKTLLLNEIAAKFGRDQTHRLTHRMLLGTANKNHEKIIEVFGAAAKHQPSVIIIDQLDRIAASKDDLLLTTAEALASSIEDSLGTAVLVIAAARTPGAIHSCLLGPTSISKFIELDVPDAASRLLILELAVGGRAERGVLESIASRTHGFTGKDLRMLDRTATNNAQDRQLDEGWVEVRPSLRTEDTSTTLVDGASESRHNSGDVHGERDLEEALTMADFELALKEVRPTAMKEIILEIPRVTWDDIGGSDDLKARFDQIIGWPLHHADELAEYQRTNWQKSVLLYGPPGCSKTMTAQAVANTYGLNFLAVKGAELLSMYVGESERAVREIFRKAQAAAPAIIFFDEIDAVGTSRDAGGNSDLHVLTTLLNEMDGFTRLKGVQVIAATNKPHALDPALLRPGRFDAHFYLAPPHVAARADIIALQLKGIKGADGLDITSLARDMEGYSGAEVVSICDLAVEAVIARAIARSGYRHVTAGDFEAAIDATARGITTEMLEVYESFGKRGKAA